MRTLYKALLVTILLSILLTTPILRADTGTSETEDHSGNITIQNGNLTAIFDGQKPSIRFFFTSNVRQVYFAKFNSLTEFNDTTNTLVFYHNESLQTASLEAANWTHSQFYNASDGATAIDFTTHQLIITPTGHMQDTTGTSHLSNTNVTITAKLYPTNTDHTVTVGNSTFTIHGGVEIKLDISIGNWPFINSNDRLALRIDLHTSINEFEVHEHDGDHEVNETHINEGDHEIDDHQGENHDHQGEGQVQLLTASGLVGGFFRFANNAITDMSSTAVAASFRFEPDEVNSAQHEFKLYLSYHSFSKSLVHDPSFGVVPLPRQSFPVFAAVSVVLIGVMSAAAVLVARRKRILL